MLFSVVTKLDIYAGVILPLLHYLEGNYRVCGLFKYVVIHYSHTVPSNNSTGTH